MLPSPTRDLGSSTCAACVSSFHGPVGSAFRAIKAVASALSKSMSRLTLMGSLVVQYLECLAELVNRGTNTFRINIRTKSWTRFQQLREPLGARADCGCQLHGRRGKSLRICARKREVRGDSIELVRIFAELETFHFPALVIFQIVERFRRF